MFWHVFLPNRPGKGGAIDIPLACSTKEMLGRRVIMVTGRVVLLEQRDPEIRSGELR